MAWVCYRFKIDGVRIHRENFSITTDFFVAKPRSRAKKENSTRRAKCRKKSQSYGGVRWFSLIPFLFSSSPCIHI